MTFYSFRWVSWSVTSLYNCRLLTKSCLEPQIKKHLTAEEHAMRRAEMARRRKNLSEKRNEEEKVHCPQPKVRKDLY